MATRMELDEELERMSEDVLRAEERGEEPAFMRNPSVSQTSATPPKQVRSPPVTSALPVRQGSLQALGQEEFTQSDRHLAAAVHVGTLAASLMSGGLLVPLLVPLIAKMAVPSQKAALSEHIRQQLNFQLTFAAVAAVGIVLTLATLGIGALVLIPALLLMLGVEVVASIKGTIAALNGEVYNFPLTGNFVKSGATTQRLPPHI